MKLIISICLMIIIVFGWEDDEDTQIKTITITRTALIAGCPTGTPNLCDNDKCVNFLTDINNCGICNNICHLSNAVPDCYGKCNIKSCHTGFYDCNNDILDGCEVNIHIDANHCGACLNSCGINELCVNGVCSNQLPNGSNSNFTNIGCVSTTSVGTGISPEEQPYTVFVDGINSITPIQCFDSVCIPHVGVLLKYFTLSLDTSNSIITTICSCYTDTNNNGFNRPSPIPNTCSNTYGVTTYGDGSWYLFSKP
jgi:hypothetical protein